MAQMTPAQRDESLREIRDRFRSIASTAADAHRYLDDLEMHGANIDEIAADLQRITELTEGMPWP